MGLVVPRGARLVECPCGLDAIKSLLADQNGFVANFAREVMKGQWPLSVRGLCG
jgi:hypothetical protein